MTGSYVFVAVGALLCVINGAQWPRTKANGRSDYGRNRAERLMLLIPWDLIPNEWGRNWASPVRTMVVCCNWLELDVVQMLDA